MSVSTQNPVPPFEPAALEAIAKVLGDTERGLTGTEIGHKLGQCRIPDVDQQNTKWRRLYNALAQFQNEHGIGNHVVKFIMEALARAAYTGTPESFEDRRQALNKVLCFSGMELGVDGRVRRARVAPDLSDALARANRMKEELRRRQVHELFPRTAGIEWSVEELGHLLEGG